MHKQAPLITFEMYLQGQLLEAVKISSVFLQAKSRDYLNRLRMELLAKHKPALAGSTDRPVFCLGGIPSCLNSFVPLAPPEPSDPDH